AFQRSDIESAAALRLRTGFQRCRSLGADVVRAAAAGERAADVCAARQRGRQRNVGSSVGAAAGAARHLPRMEHVSLRLLRRIRLRLPGRLDSFRENENGTDQEHDSPLSLEGGYGTHVAYVAGV